MIHSSSNRGQIMYTKGSIDVFPESTSLDADSLFLNIDNTCSQFRQINDKTTVS
jgi:hypothetical protein